MEGAGFEMRKPQREGTWRKRQKGRGERLKGRRDKMYDGVAGQHNM